MSIYLNKDSRIIVQGMTGGMGAKHTTLMVESGANIVGGVNREHVEARDDGKYWNVVDETIPDVSQFWTYGKDAFLKQPVYSREFPPCKYCD